MGDTGPIPPRVPAWERAGHGSICHPEPPPCARHARALCSSGGAQTGTGLAMLLPGSAAAAAAASPAAGIGSVCRQPHAAAVVHPVPLHPWDTLTQGQLGLGEALLSCPAGPCAQDSPSRAGAAARRVFCSLQTPGTPSAVVLLLGSFWNQ